MPTQFETRHGTNDARKKEEEGKKDLKPSYNHVIHVVESQASSDDQKNARFSRLTVIRVTV